MIDSIDIFPFVNRVIVGFGSVQYARKSRKWTAERKAAWSVYQRSRKLTPEQRERMSVAQRKSVADGRHASRNPEFIKNVAAKLRGRKPSKEIVEKRRSAVIKAYQNGGGPKKEHFDKLSKLYKGKPFSGKPFIHKGRKQTLEERLMRRMFAKRGPEHHAWKGQPRRARANDVKYVEWRMRVFFRDGHSCKGDECPKRSGVYITAHHIKPWATHPELRYNVENGVTLCEICHARVDPYYRNFHPSTKKFLADTESQVTTKEGVTKCP